MHRILHRSFSAAEYARLLASLLPVYQSLEVGLATHHALFPALPLSRLARSAGLAADLAFFARRVGRPALPAATAKGYAACIDDIAATEPALLLAHAYVRFLGDVSGGQILGSVVADHLELPDRQGLQFYRFDDPAGLRVELRDAVQHAPVDASLHAALCAEAERAFELNIAMFVELDTHT